MAQTKKKRNSKHRGNAAGIFETRGRTGRPLNEREQGDVESVARAHYAPMLEAFGATISAREAAE